MKKRAQLFLHKVNDSHATLASKIVDNRRKVKWRKLQNRLRLQYFKYEDEGKLDKYATLMERIRKEMLRPCPKCGAT